MVGKSCARHLLIGQSDRLEVLIESLDLFLLPEVGGSLMKLEQILQIVVQLRLDEFFGFLIRCAPFVKPRTMLIR